MANTMVPEFAGSKTIANTMVNDFAKSHGAPMPSVRKHRKFHCYLIPGVRNSLRSDFTVLLCSLKLQGLLANLALLSFFL